MADNFPELSLRPEVPLLKAMKSVSKSNKTPHTSLKKRRSLRGPVTISTPAVRTLKSRRLAATRASKSASKNQGFRAIFKDSFAAVFVLICYLTVRFGMTQKLDQIGTYATYIFELGFVVAAGLIYQDRIRLKIDQAQEAIYSFVPALVAGTLIFLGLKPLGIVAPFEMRSFEPILFLVLIGPVLEELIFRFALWNPLLDLRRKRRGGVKTALIGTSLLFGYAHLHAIWFVGADLRPFLAYQTIYVLGLAAFCGFRLMKTGSILSPMFVHIGFNLGFFLGSFL